MIINYKINYKQESRHLSLTRYTRINYGRIRLSSGKLKFLIDQVCIL